jgi:hypothetical protein
LTNEYKTLVSQVNLKHSEKNLSHCLFIYQKSRTTLEAKLGLRGEKPTVTA